MRSRRIVTVVLFSITACAVIRPALAQSGAIDDFAAALPLYRTGGWQGPNGTGNMGGFVVPAAGGQTILVDGSYNALAYAVRQALPMANFSLTFQMNLVARDGTPGDFFAFLLRFQSPTYPGECCQDVHAQSGLRVRFNLDQNVVEVLEESNGTTLTPPLASLPASLPTGQFYTIRIIYQGPLLSVFAGSSLIGTVFVPSLPAGLFGFQTRRVDMTVDYLRLTIDCTQPGDLDCDGVPDGADNCPQNPNPDQTDTDGNGDGDACDVDDDGDGVADTADLCPLVPDPGQVDTDGDLLGDACDPCPADASNDHDGDGVCGQSDNCPSSPNPDQGDGDGDGEGDVCDDDDGLILMRFLAEEMATWQQDVSFSTYSLYRGSLAVLKSTGAYTQQVGVTPLAGRTCDVTGWAAPDSVTLAPGEATFYLMTGAHEGVESGLGVDSNGLERPNDVPCRVCDRPFTTVVKTSQSGVPRQFRIIDNLADWCLFQPTRCSPSPIDFATEVAVVAAQGGRSDSCHDMMITCIQDGVSPGGIKVFATETSPGPGCACFAVIVSPLHVVKVARPADSLTLDLQSWSLVCP